MPLCIRCSAPNPDDVARCLACGNVLPRNIGAKSESDQLFSMEEGRNYPVPRESFDTENLAQLRMAIEDLLDGGDDDTEVRTWLKHIRRHFDEFANHGVSQLNQALDLERSLNSEGDFHHDVGYLIRKGTVMCDDGLKKLESALDAEADNELMSALDLFRQGNDHICTALLMIEERKELFETAIEKFAPVDADDE